jgi:hypothetical protein
MSEELLQVMRSLTQSLEQGLSGFEGSGVEAAEEQRERLRELVDELGRAIRSAVDDHLGQLNELLQRTGEQQSDLTGGLALTLERLSEDSESHRSVSEAINQAAISIRGATESISDGAAEFEPLIRELRQALSSLPGEVRAELADHVGAASREPAASGDSVADTTTPFNPAAMVGLPPASGYAAASRQNASSHDTRSASPSALPADDASPHGSLSDLLRAESGGQEAAGVHERRVHSESAKSESDESASEERD